MIRLLAPLGLVLLFVAPAWSQPNVLLICVDDLRPELNCYGVDYIKSPNIDRLAERGRVFHRHYVQAPTCGASRCALLTGRYSSGGNNALFRRAERIAAQPDSVPPSMPAWFRRHGYTTVSVGKVSHHPGGRGGARWDDSRVLEMPNSWHRSLLPAGPWQDPRGWMHGLANGEIRDDRRKPGGGIEMDVMQAVAGPDSIYPDGPSIDVALVELGSLAAADEPFFLAVGILRPHLPFGAPAKYLDLYRDTELPSIPHANKPPSKTTWHRSGEFMKYDRQGRDPNYDAEFATLVRKHYAACVSYADAQVGRLIATLEETGELEQTIVVLWGDHGWHLGEHAVWGKHTLFEESLRSPLIITLPHQLHSGVGTDAIVESIDLFPTLCEVCNLNVPDFLHGQSLAKHLETPKTPGHSAVAYHGAARTLRTNSHRLVLHKNGYAELYDHDSPEAETNNLADENAELVQQLREELNARMSLTE